MMRSLTQSFHHRSEGRGASGFFHSSDSDAVGNLVGGHVVVGQVLSFVSCLDGAGYLRQLLPELLHGILDWLLCEVRVGIHAQVELHEYRRHGPFLVACSCPLGISNLSLLRQFKDVFRTEIPKGIILSMPNN